MSNKPSGAGFLQKVKEILLWIVQVLLQLVAFLFEKIEAFLHTFRKKMKHPDYRKRFFSMMVLPVSLLYLEIVFHLTCDKQFAHASAWLYLILFSIAWGLFLYQFCCIAKNPKINRHIIRSILFVAGFVIGLQYFLFEQFRVYYDLKTVLAGTGNVVRHFFGTILRMLFSPGGLLHLALFFLPLILYFWKGAALDVARPISKKFRVRVLLGMLIFHLLALLFIGVNSTARPIYGSRYNFQYAIREFGVLTSLRKEVQHLVTGKKSGSFQNVGIEEEEKAEEATDFDLSEEAELTPVPSAEQKERNEMELDFAGSGEVESTAGIEELNRFIASQSGSRTNEYTGLFKGKNLIFLSAEAYCPWFLSEELTPTLWRLTHRGIYFSDFYQMAGSGTTGGELQNLLGLQPLEGGDSMLMLLAHNNYFAMGSQLDRLGYYGRAFHNNEYRFYDRVETHNNLGYSDSFLGCGNGMEEFVDYSLWPESDLEMMQGTLPMFIDKAPFNVYYMTVSGHSVYNTDQNDMARKNYDRVADLPYSEDVKCYIAANLELEDALTFLVEELEKKGIADDTVIVMTGDHFPYGLGDITILEELYGFPITNNLERDRNGLIIWSGSLEKQEPIVVDDPVFSVDILPTLSNLFGTDWDARLMIGRDVFSDAQPLVYNMEYDWKTDKGTYLYAEDRFIPNEGEAEADQAYIDRINTIVSNKLHMNSLLLNNDYFGYLFGKSDTQMSAEEVSQKSMSQYDEEAEENGTWGESAAEEMEEDGGDGAVPAAEEMEEDGGDGAVPAGEEMEEDGGDGAVPIEEETPEAGAQSESGPAETEENG